jgi:AcrR family transcriptional regulator
MPGEPTRTEVPSTREAIVGAALRCFDQYGPRKTTIADISRAAGVARGTVYQYFPDKGAIFRAAAARVSRAFYEAMAAVMDAGVTLDEQYALAAMFICRSKHQVRVWGEALDSEAVALLLMSHAEILLAECINFLEPYVEAARSRGEVRADLDVPGAAEWLARMLFSLYTIGSPRRDPEEPETVRAFVSAYAVAGLRGEVLEARPSIPFGLGHIADVLGAS